MSIIIYTDGSAKGNPGNGGYGIVMMSGIYRREMQQGFRLTTNNRMELLAVIVAIESIKNENSVITIYSDSKSKLFCQDLCHTHGRPDCHTPGRPLTTKLDWM